MWSARTPAYGQSMKNLLVASNNQHKFEEISAILSGLPLRMIKPGDLGIRLEVAETGSSYLENSLIKAEAFHRASGLTVLADDSGLEVELLNGAPGIHSRRFNPQPGANDRDRCLYLIKKLEGMPKPWLARFNCVAVFYQNPTTWTHYHGTVDGEIIEEFRGEEGFGYDPVFFIPPYNKTMAELGTAIKNTISHRANALKNLTALHQWANQ